MNEKFHTIGSNIASNFRFLAQNFWSELLTTLVTVARFSGHGCIICTPFDENIPEEKQLLSNDAFNIVPSLILIDETFYEYERRKMNEKFERLMLDSTLEDDLSNFGL